MVDAMWQAINAGIYGTTWEEKEVLVVAEAQSRYIHLQMLVSWGFIPMSRHI